MNAYIRSCMLLRVVIVVGCFQKNMLLADDNPVQSVVDRIHEKLVGGEIRRIEIVHIPSTSETPIRITPAMLEKSFVDKLIIRQPRRRPFERGLIEALEHLEAHVTTKGTDLRWGIIFIDYDEQRVGAIYFGAVGGSGVIDETPVSCNNSLFEWLNSHCARCFGEIGRGTKKGEEEPR